MSPEEKEYDRLMDDCMRLKGRLLKMLRNMEGDKRELEELIKLFKRNRSSKVTKKAISKLLGKYKN